jgi:hypothetical protein
MVDGWKFGLVFGASFGEDGHNQFGFCHVRLGNREHFKHRSFEAETRRRRVGLCRACWCVEFAPFDGLPEVTGRRECGEVSCPQASVGSTCHVDRDSTVFIRTT